MQIDLTEFKKQFPTYQDVPDSTLLDAIHKKYYDQISFDEFVAGIQKKYAPQTLARGGKILWEKLNPLPTIKQVVSATWSDITHVDKPIGGNLSREALKIVGGIGGGMAQERKQIVPALKNGMYDEAVRHAIGASVPIFGPLLSEAGGDLVAKDYVASAAKTAAAAIMTVGPKDIAGSSLGLKIAERAGSTKAFYKRIAEESAGGIDPRVIKVREAIRESKTLRAQQEASYTAERIERIPEAKAAGAAAGGGIKGFKAEKAALSDEFAKVEFESILKKVGQEDMDYLFRKVEASPNLRYFETLHARNGLAKLFGEGAIPQTSELILLNRVFGKGFVSDLLKKRSLWEKAKEGGYQVLNVPRAMMASFDLSAPLRQGMFFTTRPKAFFPALKEMVKGGWSEEMFAAVQDNIRTNPYYERAMNAEGITRGSRWEKTPLGLTELENVPKLREERYQSQLAEKLPVVGRFVRASGRAYEAFLNKMRMDVAADLMKKADSQGFHSGVYGAVLNKLGIKKYDLEGYKPGMLDAAICNFVNAGTGRGRLLKSLEGSAELLNATLFSPKLMASRLTLLNPVYYIKAPAFVRKQALYSLFTTAAFGTTIMQLAKMAGAEVSTDRRSADFGKISIGDTRLDMWGGFQQYFRMASQLQSGELVSSTTGKLTTVGEGYKPITRFDIALRQFETKEAPVASFITALLKGKDFTGKPMNIPVEIGNRFTPMLLSDLYDLAKSDPKLLPLGVLGTLGAGLQTYGIEGEKLTQADKKRNAEISIRLAEQERVNERRRKKADLLADELQKLPPKEANAQYEKLRQDEPKTAEAVKREVSARQRGLTFQERLIEDLGVENGERAKMIFEIMSHFKTNHEKNVYFQELVKKELITDDVYNQLKELASIEKKNPKRLKDILARRSKK